ADDDEHRNREPRCGRGVPAPEKWRPDPHHAFRRTPRASDRVVVHDRVPDDVLNSIFCLALALDLGIPAIGAIEESWSGPQRHRRSGLREVDWGFETVRAGRGAALGVLERCTQ